MFYLCQERDVGLLDENEIHLLERYEFTLVLESDIDTDWVGKRLFHALKAGSIPIYSGAENIDDFLPTSAASCIIKVWEMRMIACNFHVGGRGFVGLGSATNSTIFEYLVGICNRCPIIPLWQNWRDT
jgi:hypothetical protein